MSVVHTEYGYAELEYLRDEYATAVVAGSLGSQFRAEIASAVPIGAQLAATIVDYQVPLAGQTEGEIAARESRAAQLLASIQAVVASGAQLRGQIVDSISPSGAQFEAFILPSEALGAQISGTIEAVESLGSQVNVNPSARVPAGSQYHGEILDFRTSQASQWRAEIATALPTGAQFLAIPNHPRAAGAQFVAGIVSHTFPQGARFYKNTVFHSWDLHAVYAVHDYGVDTYLTRFFSAHLNSQFFAIIGPISTAQGAQLLGIIPRSNATGAQFIGVIKKERELGSQFTSVHGYALGAQYRSVLYNTRNIRILWEFPSRGTAPGNWTANSTATGDFSVSNLNTDVVEQVWRSAPGVKTGIRLDCDTGAGQNVFLDTLAILNHNMTRSAAITIQGDDDPAFGSPGVVFTLSPVDLENTYYIAQELPLQGYRYWRISIDDFTNPNNYIEIGTIVFGEATIMTEQECFSNPIKFRKVHYSDTVETEGFTTVSNDRGVKRQLTLDFKNINFSGGNYSNFQEMFDAIRTSHKALWIPTPQYPSRYALFGKLAAIPDEEHTDNGENADYVDFTVEVDEAK